MCVHVCVFVCFVCARVCVCVCVCVRVGNCGPYCDHPPPPPDSSEWIYSTEIYVKQIVLSIK